MRLAGLMSGTSLDGIDVAIVDLDRKISLLAFDTVAYSPDLRAALLAALPPNAGAVRDVCALNVLVGEAFAAALHSVARAAAIDLQTVDCVGSHGHTLYHLPVDDGRTPFAPSTLQIGDQSTISQRTGLTCIGDFRSADIAAGGQGAPLVAFVDFALLRSASEYRATVNIGGIANVTILPPNCTASEVVAFDCGPGNMLIDACSALATDGELTKDEDGKLAKRGAILDSLLTWLLEEPFYKKLPPKTAGREQFGRHYAEEIWKRARAAGAAPEDVVATVTALTAVAIARAIPEQADLVIVSGGGAHNPSLMKLLAQTTEARTTGARTIGAVDFSRPKISRSDEFGLPADAKEAIAFAVLAAETIHGRAGNLPAATGAREPVILGTIAPGKNFQRLMAAVSAS